jgi:urea transport system permease protein
MFQKIFLLCLLLWMPFSAHSLTVQQARAMATGDNDERSSAIAQAVLAGDPSLESFLLSLLNDEVKVAGELVFVQRDGKTMSLATGAEAALPADAEDVSNNNRLRSEIESAIASLKLLSGDVPARTAAIKQLKEQPDDSRLPLIDKALAVETDATLKSELGLLRSALLIASPDKAKRLEAASALGSSYQGATKSLLMERLQPGAEDDPQVRAALQASLNAVSSRLAWGERLGVVFTGLSLGSILLLVALGLAITYGLMGVINMAHGELLMIGAYATYVVQNLFRAHLPQYFDHYMLLAVPVSFLVAALVGAVMERGVIRWLYGRPLETLLAAWGISLVLMQSVRSVFGAQNVQVENPAWLSGGVEVMSNLTLPYNRLAIIVFAVLVLLGVSLLISRTRLGVCAWIGHRWPGGLCFVSGGQCGA